MAKTKASAQSSTTSTTSAPTGSGSGTSNAVLADMLNARLKEREDGGGLASSASLEDMGAGTGEADRDAERDAFLVQDVKARLDVVGLDDIKGRYKKDEEVQAHLPFLHSLLELKTAPPIEQPMTEAYKGLPDSPKDYKGDFVSQAENHKSSVTVVKAMTVTHERALLDREAAGLDMTREESERSAFIKEREKSLKAAAGALWVLLDPKMAGDLDHLVRNQVETKSKPMLAAMGETAFELIALEANESSPVTVPKAALGKALFDYAADVNSRVEKFGGSVWGVLGPLQGKKAELEKLTWAEPGQRDEKAMTKLRGEIKDLEATYKKDHGPYAVVKEEMEKLRLFAMPWSEATAALGQDPFGQAITDSFSVVASDYNADVGGGKKGKDEINDKMADVESDGSSNAWTDMDLGFSMWSMAGNIDRYRNTDVHLYSGAGGADVTRGGERGDSRVTQLELQVASQQDEFGKVTETTGAGGSAYNVDSFQGKVGGDAKKVMRVLPDGTRLFEDGHAEDATGKVIKPATTASK